MKRSLVCAVTFLLSAAPLLIGQSPGSAAPAGVPATGPVPTPTAPAPDALASVRQQLELAGQDNAAQKYADALAIYKSLFATYPNVHVPLLEKLAAEAAINAGDMQYATGLLAPLEAANPDDWQAAALMARIYAEGGDQAHRDAEMARLNDLHAKGSIPAGVQQYLLEKIHEPDRAIWVSHSLTPWGGYHVYDYARVFDGNGQLLFRLTLESDDFDQPSFAKQHPADAAAGKRAFSFDGYREGPTNGAQRTEVHMTYALLPGEPSYDEVRAAFIRIATGEMRPISNNTHNIQ